MRTIMQSSVAMQQSYTRGPRQLFLSSERGGEGGGGREQANKIRKNCNSVFCSNAADLYLWTKAIASLQ